MPWNKNSFAPSLVLFCLLTTASLKEIDSKSDLLQEESMTIPAEHRAYGDVYLPADLPAMLTKKNAIPGKYEPSSNEVWPLSRAESSQIKAINVKCEKNLMKVNIEFDRPFQGLIFSKGHYSDPKCVHLPAGSGQLQANFDIYLGSCGMTSSEQTSATSATSLGLFIENTIIVQYDPQVQEIWDQARRLRCTWYDFYEKAVTFRPFNVDMLDAVTANFLGDNIQCWMQIQVGKGPWASEVAGIVKIGQTMTMVLAIKDEENKFDMLVRNCIAHDGKHQPIQLVDENGCIVRPKIMSKFQKVKNFGHSATVVSYAYFQGFKFPDSMNVHFQCVIQVCRNECPLPPCESTSTDFGDTLPPNARESTFESDKRFINRIGEMTPSSTTESSANRSAMHPKAFTSQASSSSPQPNLTETNYFLSGIGAMPRSLNLNKLRRRRGIDKVPNQEISTEKVIQVVAPGDVAFNLPLSMDNQADVVQKKLETGNVFCMSTSGFAAGLVLLILLLLLTCIITIFLIIRLRNMSKEQRVNYRCPNHPEMACSCELSLVQSQYYLQIPAVHLANIS